MPTGKLERKEDEATSGESKKRTSSPSLDDNDGSDSADSRRSRRKKPRVSGSKPVLNLDFTLRPRRNENVKQTALQWVVSKPRHNGMYGTLRQFVHSINFSWATCS